MAYDVRDSRLYQASMLPVNYFSVGAQNCFVLVLVSTLIFYNDVQVSLNESTCSRILQDIFKAEICSKKVSSKSDFATLESTLLCNYVAPIAGFLVAGVFSDFTGRKFSAFLFLVTTILATSVLVVSESGIVIYTASCIKTYAVTGTLLCLVISVIESNMIKRRALILAICYFTWVERENSLVYLNWYSLNWKDLTCIFIIPLVAFCLILNWALEESPQWLFVQGQDKQAKQLLILNGTAGYDEGLSSFYARNKRESEDAIEVLVATTLNNGEENSNERSRSDYCKIYFSRLLQTILVSFSVLVYAIGENGLTDAWHNEPWTSFAKITHALFLAILLTSIYWSNNRINYMCVFCLIQTMTTIGLLLIDFVNFVDQSPQKSSNLEVQTQNGSSSKMLNLNTLTVVSLTLALSTFQAALFLQLLNLVEILPTKQRGIGTGVLFSGIVMLVLASSSEIGLNFGVNNFDFFEDYHICVMFLACQTLSTGLLKTVEKFSHFQGSLHHTTKEQASALAGLRNTNTHQKIDSTIPLPPLSV